MRTLIETIVERDRIEQWQRISTIDVETDAVHALRMAIVLMCEAPDDSAAREGVRALAASQDMEDLLVPLLAAEARQTRDPAVIAALHDERTRALAAVGESPSELAELQAAIQKDPDRPLHRERFARACYLAGAWTHAGEALEQLAPYLPAASATVVLRAAGRLYRNAGRNDRALVAYRALAVRQPSDVATLVLLAELINTPGSGNTAFDPAELAEPPAALPSAAASLAFALAEPEPPPALALDEPEPAPVDRLATVVGAESSIDASPSLAPIELELAPSEQVPDAHETETVLRRTEPPEPDPITLRREPVALASAEPTDLRDADTVAFGQWADGQRARIERAPSETRDLEANTITRPRVADSLDANTVTLGPQALRARAADPLEANTVTLGPRALVDRPRAADPIEASTVARPQRAPSESLEADSVTLGARAFVESTPAPAGAVTGPTDDRMQTVLDSLLLDEPEPAPVTVDAPPATPRTRSKRNTAGLKIFDHLDLDEVDARLTFAFGDDRGDAGPSLPARTPADFDRESASVGEVVVDVDNLVELSSAPVVPVESPPSPRTPTLRPPSTPSRTPTGRPPSVPAAAQRTPTGRPPSLPRPATPIPVGDRSPSLARPGTPIPVSPTSTDPLGPPLPPATSRAPTPVPLARVSRRLGRVEKTPSIIEVARPPRSSSQTPNTSAQSTAPTQRARPQPPTQRGSDAEDRPAHISVQFDAIDDSSLDLEPVAAPPPAPPPPVAERAAVPLEVSPAASGPNLILRDASAGLVVPPEVQRMIDEAKAMVRAGNLQSAETRLRNLVRARPLETAGHLALVDLLRANKRYDDAADHLDQVLGTVPGSAKELRAALVHRYALVAAAAGAADDAHDMLCEANELDPANLSIALALGESMFARGDFDEAARRLAALHDHPDATNHARAVARGLVHAAEAETHLGHAERAAANYEAALRIDPGCVPAQQALAAQPSAARR